MIYFIGNSSKTEGLMENEEGENYEIYYSSLEKCVEWIKPKEVIEIDTETIKNFTDPSGHIYTFQVGDKYDQFVIDATLPRNQSFIKAVLKSDRIKILQNASYDIKWFLKWGINPTNIRDTMLNEIILNCGYNIKSIGVGLDKLGMRYLNTEISKTIRGRINYLGLVPSVIDYAAGDVAYLSEILEKQTPFIVKKDLINVAKLENEVVRVFAEMEFNGIKLDPDKWLEINKHHISETIRREKEMMNYLLKHPVRKLLNVRHTLFNGDEIGHINFNSSQQVIKLVNKIGQVKNIKELKKVTSVNEKDIEGLAYLDDFIGLYLDYKSEKTAVSKYGKNFLKHINPYTKRVHTNYWQILDTGRVSSSNPNLQQIKARSLHRNAFIPEKGYKFVTADFSSQELVLIAEDSGEPVWIEATLNNWDLHSYVAEMVFKDIWKDAKEEGCAYYASKSKCDCKKHKKLRDQIKTINYAIAYGAGHNKIAAQLRIHPKEAKMLIDDYFYSMKKLEIHFNTLADHAISNLEMRTFKPFRRVRNFYMPREENYDNDTHSIGRQGMNSRFQGTGADMMKYAMVKLYKFFRSNYPAEDIKFILQVHDELLLEVKEEIAHEVLEHQIRIMRDSSRIFLNTIPYVDAEGKVMDFWTK